MSQPTITTKLVRGGQVVPAGPSVPVGSDGTEVVVGVPPGLEIVDAALAVQVPDDSAPVELLTGAAITTSTGVWPGPDGNKLAWFSADWRARRAIVGLSLTLRAGAEATLLRLRIADEGGPWVLVTPTPLIAPVNGGFTVRFAGLAASRIMVELVKPPQKPVNGPEDYVPADSAIAAISVLGSRRPPTLTVSLAPATVVHHEPGLLPPAATRSVREPLLAALRRGLPDAVGGAARIVVRAPIDGELRRLALTLGARMSLTRWPGDRATLELAVGPGVTTTATLPLTAHPTSFAVRVLADLRAEQAPAVPQPPGKTAWAHRCGPASALAQGFRFTAGGALVGVDLWLAVRTSTLRGRVELHADEHGGPGAVPLATLELELAAPTAGVLASPAWLGLDLPVPLVVAAGERVWVALVLDAGEALWVLDGRAPGGPADGLVRRERGAAWVPRDMSFPTGPADLWAVARPRLRHDGPPLPLALGLRRGPARIGVLADADGRVRLDAAALAPLNAGAADLPIDLTIVSPSAGVVTLRDLHVDLPAQTTTWTFGSA